MARKGLRGALAVAGTLMVAVPASAGASASSGGTAPGDGSQSQSQGQSNPTAKARISHNGRTAIPPDSAPPQVKRAIYAANKITRKPYRYGGGHGKWNDSGYDCSGSVSYALHGGGLLRQPLDSSSFMHWGRGGRGRWITIYANSGHAYVIIAGLRFDTSSAGAGGGSGPRWRNRGRSSSGYVARHPSGF
jgi:hypothetical protein